MLAGSGNGMVAPSARRPERGFPADDLFQGAALHVEIVQRGDFLGGGEVVTRLGLVGVGDGGRAHLEALARLGQLFREGLLLGLGRGQDILGAQDVEIGGGDRSRSSCSASRVAVRSAGPESCPARKPPGSAGETAAAPATTP
jgi:hypothetical protein